MPLSGLELLFAALSAGQQDADRDCRAYGQGGGEDVCVGDKGGGAVGVDDLLRAGEDRRADGGADDAGDQHL